MAGRENGLELVIFKILGLANCHFSQLLKGPWKNFVQSYVTNQNRAIVLSLTNFREKIKFRTTGQLSRDIT